MTLVRGLLHLTRASTRLSSKARNSSSSSTSSMSNMDSTNRAKAIQQALASQQGLQLRGLVDAWVHGGQYPGAVMGVYDREGGEMFYHEVNSPRLGRGGGGVGGDGSEGIEGEGEGPLFKRDSIFRIYSMTKPITSVAIMLLLQRNLLSLDDPLHKYIPAFNKPSVLTGGDAENPILEAALSDITLRHLLTHTSGLAYALFGSSPVDILIRRALGPGGGGARNFWRGLPLEQLCDGIAKAPLSFQPGSHFLYGFNFEILGRVVEVVSGKTLDVFFTEEIFGPLGMVDTGFHVPEADWGRLVGCYENQSGHAFAHSKVTERDRETSPICLQGGGGLVSTLSDYAKFATFLLHGTAPGSGGEPLLVPHILAQMTANQLPNDADLNDMSFAPGFLEVEGGGFGFGLGMSVVKSPSAAGGSLSGVGEFGWGGFASTWFYCDPTSGHSLVFLTQLTPSSAYPLRSQLRYMCHRAVAEAEAEKEKEAVA
ncbi:beta-lactamase/transpeptidase-like protein [Ochromonadaceae sp. CCMP2298]|nr:beta-lactamase/transpeptidase-like protein [Ochromonadaceae sp. CCMP2298]